MTEDQRQEKIKTIRAELAAIQRQEAKDEALVRADREAALDVRLESMSAEELLDEMASATIRVADSFRGLFQTKTKPLIGGTFDQGTWRLNSSIMRWTDMGLHCLQYWISDPDHLICIGNGTTKSEAFDMGRRVIAKLGRHRLDEIVAVRKRELVDIRASELVEQRAIWEQRKKKDVPEYREKQVPRRRLTIFNKSGGKCHYCACALDLKGKWHVEHKMPRALMGSNADDNLVASCVPCNMKKRDKTDLEFIASKGAA